MRTSTMQQTTAYLSTRDLSSLRRGKHITLAVNGSGSLALAYDGKASVNGSQPAQAPRKRKRAHKPMSRKARAAISKRMRAFWAERRKKKGR